MVVIAIYGGVIFPADIDDSMASCEFFLVAGTNKRGGGISWERP